MQSTNLEAGESRSAMSFSLPKSNIIIRKIAWQLLAAIVLFWGFAWMVGNLNHNLTARHIPTGFGFLHHEAGLPISEHLISYSPENTYFRALFVGTLNTLWVAFWGIVFSTILGTTIGISKLSKNWLLSKIASIYVEFFRGVPLLLQLFFWYMLMHKLPSVRNAIKPISNVFLSNRGLSFPVLAWQTSYSWVLLASIIGLVITWILAKKATYKRLEDGQQRKIWPVVVILLIISPIAVGWALGTTIVFNIPKASIFNIQGGMTLSPEFFALLIGLTVYNAAFIAEIVRSGLEAIGKGQREAARALGLAPKSTLKWIVFPQALRVIVPPLTTQYLDLTKSSSLAVAIGYQDLFSIASTAMNQTGQAIELVATMMSVYLTISLSISLLMNFYNSRIALVER